MGDLLAPAPDQWAGVWLAEDLESIRRGVENGCWVDGSLGVVGAGLDALAMVIDPAGALLQCGAAWLIEHVKPLSEALEWLTGDPVTIAANARAWRDVAGELDRQSDEIGRSVRADLSEWSGAAGDRYCLWTGQQQQALGALARASETMAAITEGAGFLIAAVRLLVRDAVATVVSRLIIYAAETVASLGAATPLVLGQVAALISTWTARITGWLRSLLSSLRNLVPLAGHVSDLIDRIRRILTRLSRAPEPSLNRVQKRGTGPVKLFTLDSVREVATKYGIDVAGLNISLGSKTVRGICGRTLPDGSVVLFPTAFRSEENLARTLAHERFHHDELAAGRPFPEDAADFDAFEDRAYAHEEQWWNNQPIRPEPRTR
ncbi:WXG100 family type VII secretion target [Actinoplanes sp. GCM10030250]|uniref:WXG100 family type VII secretion target n=1 Tax=Actinoplanes sp. GCM10030250 TaxID=3273376 RepID=UPI00361CC9DD